MEVCWLDDGLADARGMDEYFVENFYEAGTDVDDDERSVSEASSDNEETDPLVAQVDEAEASSGVGTPPEVLITTDIAEPPRVADADAAAAAATVATAATPADERLAKVEKGYYWRFGGNLEVSSALAHGQKNLVRVLIGAKIIKKNASVFL